MEWRRLELIYGTTLVFGGPVTELRVFWSMLRLHRQPTLIIRHTIWQLQYNCLNTDTDMPGKAGSGGEWYKHIYRCNLHFAVGQPHTAGAGQLERILPRSGG